MKLGLISGIAALVLSASTLAAQQPQNASPDHRPGMEAGGKMSMMMMDSLNHRLDSLVERMNRTTGNQKMQAMATVINELVAQRKAMQARMHQMMEGGGMMGMMRESTSTGPKFTAKADSVAADTTDHAAHHPPN
jgi:predicted transcriptional regulator